MTTNIATLSPASAIAGTEYKCPLEEIEFGEIEIQNKVGQGTYGVVKKAILRGKTVAVKVIEGDMARKAFLVELYQLSRVKHKNIINLYGACTKDPVCLVMEYAECGSLHKVVHFPPKPFYKMAHAMSWMLQCAEGMEYLHSLEPRPLVHRDLKPLNLLLIDHGRQLKICDFGTACRVQTNMTNNKGSAQWMAPEVFEGSRYSEKCDVFSWGIMLWEVLTRRKPFEEVGGTSYTVMWAVHSGQRPPLIQNCPKPIEILMTRCWDKNPAIRPAMIDVVKIMSRLMEMFKGADEPLNLSGQMDVSDDDVGSYSLTDITVASALGGTAVPDDPHGEFALTLPAMPANVQRVRSMDLQKTAPASLTGSEGDLLLSLQRSAIADRALSGSSGHTRGHRRAGSYDTSAKPKLSGNTKVTSTVSVQNASRDQSSSTVKSTNGKLPRFNVEMPDTATSTEASVFDSDTSSHSTGAESEESADVPLAYLALDAQFQPLRPFPGSRESHEIFLEHCRSAEEYIKIQEEVALTLKRKQVLITELSNNIKEAHQMTRYQEYQQLLKEKAQLQELQRTLKADLEEARRRRKS